MVFSSLLFIFIYLPLSLLLYYLCPSGKNYKIKNALLFFISLIFYAWGEPIYVFLMLFSVILNFVSAKMLCKYKKQRKLFLVFAIVINLSMLVFFKYTGFIIENFSVLSGIHIPYFEVALPVGISFYTFQALSYTVDIYRGEAPLQKNFLSFGAYIALFPQLIAGPIVRYKSVSEQLCIRKHSIEKFSSGVLRFTQGLAKKVLLANNLGLLWNAVQKLDGERLTTLSAWLGITAFALQIYFDFSGYSDMAIGLGRMFGFEFPENFDYPYTSKSITEFWRRWHISLGTWFREYVYIPLGGNRTGKARTYLNLLTVWLLTGIWHGAGWGFIIWGLYFGMLIIIEKAFLLRFLNKIPSLFSRLYLIFGVLFSWTFFAIEDYSVRSAFLSAMFARGSALWDSHSFFLLKSYGVLLIAGIIFCVPVLRKLRIKRLAIKFSPVICPIVWILSTAFLVSESYNPFLYFKF